MGDLALSLSMILLFISKLWHLTEDLVLSQNESHNQNEHVLQSRMQPIIHLIAKIVILSLFAIISSQIQVILHCFYTLSYVHSEQEVDYNFIIISYYFWAVNNFMNIVVVFLSFDYNLFLYHRTCGLLHECCMRCCHYCTRRGLIRRKILDPDSHFVYRQFVDENSNTFDTMALCDPFDGNISASTTTVN